MSSRNNKGKPKFERIQKEGEFQEVEQEQAQDNGGKDSINLEDIGFMVMIGRYKDGKPFFTNVNVNDVFTVDGLLNYAKRQLDHTYREHFEDLDAQKRG